MPSLYQALLAPQSSDPDHRNRELVLNYLVVGLIILVVGECLDMLFGLIFMGHRYALTRLAMITIVGVVLVALHRLTRHQHRLAAGIVVATFLMAGCLLAYHWGTITPTATLLFSLVIVMAGILLGARYSLYLALLISGLLIGLEHAKTLGVVQPDLAWMSKPTTVRDVVSLAFIYLTLALVSWLFNRQMEQSLRRARQSEAELRKQRDLLEVTVQERTRQLEAAQLEKVQQIYRFAELGRISSALFHDLANHLTNVSLEIEGLGRQGQSKIMDRVQHDINYIDDVVQRVRSQLRGQASSETFGLQEQINKIVKIVSYRANKAHVRLVFNKPVKPIYYTADLTRFRQIIINLLNNAVDACGDTGQKSRQVTISLRANRSQIILQVTDTGIGMTSRQKSQIFKPFYSTKDDGTGIGLFVVKQLVEKDLGGKINVVSRAGHGTKFTVQLPCSPP